ncbi:MAG: GGDEF domain-containing response regulator [Phycisphaerales bacterium]
MLRTIVVDDHPTSRTFLQRILASEGLTPIMTDNGHDALAVFDAEPIDIWFVDWLMPQMSGLELVRALRGRTGGAYPYVIMLTSKGSEEDLATAFDAGVDDFMVKPVGAMELFARLKAGRRLVGLNATLQDHLRDIKRLNGELTTLNSQLEEMASTDGLTGLLNRRSGMMKLTEIWDKSVRERTNLSVAMIDIDHFKNINDTFGHARGDSVIRHISAVLSEFAREEDLVVRIGGEEFLLVLPGAELSAAAGCVDRVRQNISHSVCRAGEHHVGLSISAGVAMRDNATTSAEHLVRRADEALYAAKKGGRNCVVKSLAGTPTDAPTSQKRLEPSRSA